MRTGHVPPPKGRTRYGPAPASPALADASAVTGGNGTCGVKESFRSYISGPIAKDESTPTGGATRATDGTFVFPVLSGEHDVATGDTTVSFGGGVLFQGHDHGGGAPLLQLTLREPRVEIVGTTGTLSADVVSKALDAGELVDYPDVTPAALDLSGTTAR
ncbi:hypothetical protein Nans01_47830 [Nocardiopsis ansamitocini]|uniref:Htaa domain-containing protein n=1 Tax=Nocardiopsis ansamitocini TaxID=1670832 RepID=A0A9W6UL73_9ACTN|nr:hypothetical protein Nans01_47830 [Nocardiopsis ansamitocini]